MWTAWLAMTLLVLHLNHLWTASAFASRALLPRLHQQLDVLLTEHACGFELLNEYAATKIISVTLLFRVLL